MSPTPVQASDPSRYTPPPPTTDQLRPGETLAEFAARHQVSVQAVREANASLLQTVNNDRRHHEPGLTESQALAGADLTVPPPPMSVTEDPLTSDFNPTYPSSNSEYTVGADGQTVGGAVTWNPGDGSVKVTGSQIATPPGQTDQSPVQYQVRQDTAVAYGQTNKDGNTEFTVEAQVSTSASVSASSETRRGPVEGEFSAGEGLRARYKVTLPGENQTPEAAANVNPFDPTTIPVGATVTMDAQAFTQTDLAGSFRNIATATSIVDAEGASYSVTRVDENNIRVTMGPNEAIEAYNGVGVSTDIATAMLGRQDSLGGSFVNTAQFDLSNPDGQAAYAHFVATGEVAHQTPGVSDVAQIGRIDYSSQTRAKFELGPVTADLAGAQNTGSRVDVTYPDGSYTSTIQLQYSGNAPLQVSQSFDAAGNEIVSERSYQFTVDTDRPAFNWWQRNIEGRNEANEEANAAGIFNDTFTGDMDSGLVQPGEKVTITFTEAQMQALVEQTRDVADDGNVGGTTSLDILANTGEAAPTTLDFAVSMARNLSFSQQGGFGMELWQISGNGERPIDATVTAE